MKHSAKVTYIYRYPIKGLNPQSLESVFLEQGQGLYQDRRFALLHAAGKFDFDNPTWQPKHNFVTLKYYERLAGIKMEYEEETTLTTIFRNGRPVVHGNLDTPTGRTLIQQFFSAYLEGVAPVPVKIVYAPDTMFTDSQEKLVSIVFLESIQDLQRIVQKPIDPLRFRGNFILSGFKAWSELSWCDRYLTLGQTRLQIIERTGRCAATNVDPITGIRDFNIPRALLQGYGHSTCGVYARVIASGAVAVGDTAILED